MRSWRGSKGSGKGEEGGHLFVFTLEISSAVTKVMDWAMFTE